MQLLKVYKLTYTTTHSSNLLELVSFSSFKRSIYPNYHYFIRFYYNFSHPVELNLTLNICHRSDAINWKEKNKNKIFSYK